MGFVSIVAQQVIAEGQAGARLIGRGIGLMADAFGAQPVRVTIYKGGLVRAKVTVRCANKDLRLAEVRITGGEKMIGVAKNVVEVPNDRAIAALRGVAAFLHAVAKSVVSVSDVGGAAADRGEAVFRVVGIGERGRVARDRDKRFR